MKTKNRLLVRDCKGQLANEPERAYAIAKSLLMDEYKEHFIVIHLNARNIAISAEVVSIGTLDASMVHPRETFRTAVTHRCANIIVAHNHPTGDCEPSEADITTTRRLVEAGKILGINLIDHIVFSGDNFVSLRKQGLI